MDLAQQPDLGFNLAVAPSSASNHHDSRCDSPPYAEPAGNGRIEHALRLIEKGQLQSARGLIEEASFAAPENVELVLALGDILMLLGDAASAQREFMKATVLAPSNAVAFAKLATVLFTNGRFQSSEFYARRAVGLDPGQCGALEVLEKISEGGTDPAIPPAAAPCAEPPVELESPALLAEEAESCLQKKDLRGCVLRLKQIVRSHAREAAEDSRTGLSAKSPFSTPEFKKPFAGIMRSPHGATIRREIPELYPWCDTLASTQRGFSIHADGAVTTCCFDCEGENRFGSIHEDDIRELCERYDRIRTGDLYNLSFCSTCAGLDVKYAPSLINRMEDRSRFVKGLSKYPYCIGIEPISVCNYSCDGCPSTYIKRHSKLDLELAFRNLKSCLPRIDKILFGLYGEPLLHPDLGRFITQCRQAAPALNLHILTNGTYLTRELAGTLVDQKLDHICVALHGGPGTENMLKYSKRGADYDKVMNNVENLIAVRKERNSKFPQIQLRVVLFNWNDSDEDMDRFRRDVRALGLEKQDTYFWVLDVAGSEHPRSSKRFLRGSPELQRLIDAKEFSYW